LNFASLICVVAQILLPTTKTMPFVSLLL
jgi:hypothetical protein